MCFGETKEELLCVYFGQSIVATAPVPAVPSAQTHSASAPDVTDLMGHLWCVVHWGGGGAGSARGGNISVTRPCGNARLPVQRTI